MSLVQLSPNLSKPKIKMCMHQLNVAIVKGSILKQILKLLEPITLIIIIIKSWAELYQAHDKLELPKKKASA